MALSSDAKKLLNETIRGSQQDPHKGLRARLLRDIHDEAERRYRFSVPVGSAGLDEAHRMRRARIEAWIDERTRAGKPQTRAEEAAAATRLRLQAEKDAAATLINRLVVLRQLEALGRSKPPVVSGGWNSRGYREFREFAPGLCSDETEGYSTLLALLFDELAIDLPGLFGDVGLTRLFPIPPATLREVIERLDVPGLASAWTDDTTLGWVYQYWNDPDREALDDKISAGKKIQPHEIASKTQMFTERYMVEWLLQNSLGLTWLRMCKRDGFVADAEAVLPVLEARRADFRAQRQAGTVAADALMPVVGDLEDRWKYYVPQPLPAAAPAAAAPDAAASDSRAAELLGDALPARLRDLRILDPACGSGHFLVIAFDLLFALYREEARHRGETPSDAEIAASILEHNLHGIDIDPRAIQIAAAALYLKAKACAKDTRLRTLNLVAPTLQLAKLPPDDPALGQLRRDLKHQAGIPEELTESLVSSLAGVDYLGSLLKVDAAIERALDRVELQFSQQHGQGDLFGGFPAQQVTLSLSQAKATIVQKLEQFLARHSKSQDLGLRLDGEQLAAGVRFVRIAHEGRYDLVVGNPPYQGLSKTESFGYVAKTYEKGKADLYAAFLERSLEFLRPGGISALLTMRGWMFLGQFSELRTYLLQHFDLRSIGDFDRGAFDEVPNEVLSVCAPIFRKLPHSSECSVALQPTPLDDKSYDRQRTNRKRAAVLAQVGRYEFDPRGFSVIEGEPIVYWWSREFLCRYNDSKKLGQLFATRKGVVTGDDSRFSRLAHEVSINDRWKPFIMGGKGAVWFEPLRYVINWWSMALELNVFSDVSVSVRLRDPEIHLRGGISFSQIGNRFEARAHRHKSIIGNKGSSIFPDNIPAVLLSMNSSMSRNVIESLNPGIGFELGDINRLPLTNIVEHGEIFNLIDGAFSEHEAAREASVEFKRPGRSAWAYAQGWAQRAVDRGEGEALPAYAPEYEEPSAAAWVSFAVGVALGRFAADGSGILDRAPESALPGGILFVGPGEPDSLDQPACAPLRAAWDQHGATVGDGPASPDSLRAYLRRGFFDLHKKLYENRPIYFPLSSVKKSFVAWVSLHRFADDTLNVLLADHLLPVRRRLDGELADLRSARLSAGGNKNKLERRFAEVQKLLEELSAFIAAVTEITETGPPPPDDKTPRREVDARFAMDLDDGVMVNSAALWPLLDPQWKDPKKWWRELATAQGKKDYDWAHLAARYFPRRVAPKCAADPSLAVAHRCFWRLHPAKAYAWELRLQDEIRPDFTIDEPGSDAARAQFLTDHAEQARDIEAAEAKRRERKAQRAAQADDADSDGPLLSARAGAAGEDADAEDDPDADGVDP